MSSVPPPRLRIPSHYSVYAEPPDRAGVEVLHFVSAHRRVVLKGHSFREFLQRVVPLLNGMRTLPEIHEHVRDVFETEDLKACINVLSENGLLEDAGRWSLAEVDERRLRPQLNLLHDLSAAPWELQERLARARVAVVGLTGVGMTATRSLVAAGVGVVRGVDDGRLTDADLYFSPEPEARDVGELRCAAIERHLRRQGARGQFESVTGTLADDSAVAAAISGVDFVISGLDEGNLSLAYRLNRVCLQTKMPWISASASGFEVVVGPAVHPGVTACYVCYRMRMVACAENPDAAFAFEGYLDRRRRDDSDQHANLVFGTALAGQLASAEAMKSLTGAGPLATLGRVHVFDMRDFKSTLHAVLRKPWCPACMAHWDQEANT